VPDIGMAPLAQVRHLCLEKRATGRAVRGVAGDAVFYDRGMIPEKGSPQISVALKTLLVDFLSIYKFVRNSSVGVMAIGALGLSLPYRMVGLPHEISPDVRVASGAHFYLIGSRTGLRLVFVDAVTVRA
jgi:hypothetical protein